MPLSSDELLELLRSHADGTGVLLGPDNVVATASLIVRHLVEVWQDKDGQLRVRLKREDE